MANNYVTLTGNLGTPAANATAIFTPSNWLTDDDNALVFPPAPVEVGLDGKGKFSVDLLATDNGSPQPNGWTWSVEFLVDGLAPRTFSFDLAHADGATQDISSFSPVEPVDDMAAYLPLPTGTAKAGQVPVATGSASASAWGYHVGLQPSGDTTGATDLANIQALLNLGDASLALGDFYISAPLVLQGSGIRLRGSGGATGSAGDVSTGDGTRIHIVAGFTNPNSWSALVTAAIVCIQTNPGGGSAGSDSSNSVSGHRFTDFWIDGSASPASVDGIACYGTVSAFQAERVGVWKVTGRGFAMYSDPTFSTGNFPDGQHMYSCLVQGNSGSSTGREGFYGIFTDAVVTDCHAQGLGTGSDGFNISGANNRWIGCRSDLNRNGFTIEAGFGSGYFDTNILTGCGTQRNDRNGLNVVNTSSGGTTVRSPVVLDWCVFSEDGKNGGSGGGGYAGIAVQGVNTVMGTAVVTVGTVDVGGGCPAYGLATAGSGSPTVILTGGMLNYVTAPVNDAAPAATLNLGPTTLTASGYSPSAPALQSAYGNLFGDGSDGAAVLDGSATVAWASKSGSTYTLTRNAKLTSLTVNNGVTLICKNFMVFCRGTVTVNSGGFLDASGAAGQANGTAGATQGSGITLGGRAGGAGNTGAGSAGTGQATVLGVGSAGAGGSGSSGAGGAAGAVTNNLSVVNATVPPLQGIMAGFGNVFILGASPGGGGGTGDGANKGGGGGSGGSCIFIAAWHLVNNGTIQAPGGNGGTPATGNCGGGGAGSGGLVLIYTLTPVTGSGSISVAAGSPGSGVNSGTSGGTASAGSSLTQVLS